MSEQPYHPYHRQEIATWLLSHIDTLLGNAVTFRDSSMVIYACFEMRNFIEKLEFYIIAAALTEEERQKEFKGLTRMAALSKAFGKVIQEKAHTYIRFINALCIAKPVPFSPLGRYDFKILNRFKLELNAYCHLYSRMQNELEFDSDFIQNGLALPGRVYDHLIKAEVLHPRNGINIVGISVSQLKADSLEILNKLRRNEIKNDEELIEALKNSTNL